MQHQETEQSISGSDGETKTANGEEIQLTIDFDNIEDILDFSVHSVPEAISIEDFTKLHKRLIAEEPVKLLDLKPIIDNFVDDLGVRISEKRGVNCKTKVKGKRRFQCIFCGNKFIRSTHLYRHLRIHTGDKPYFCHICRRRFSRCDYMKAHVQSHRNKKVNYCYVCGEAYHDMTRFVYHCRSHDDSEYIRIASKESEALAERQIQIVEKPILASTFAKQIELTSCFKIEKRDNSTDEECIVYVENPMYSSHQMIATNNSEGNPPSGISPSDGLIVSINVAHLP